MKSRQKSPSNTLFLKAMKQKFTETESRDNTAGGVYESAPHRAVTEKQQIEGMLANIIDRLERIEEKIDENVYPPESAIRPEFIRRVKKARADSKKGNGKRYESMDAFIRAISE
jgi:hypothetical protein